jgi:sigma-B regulation protein RsbU (phosphoserine phosphatase)
VHQRGHRLPAAAGSKIVEITRLNHALNDASAALSIQYQRLRDGEARKSAFLEASLDCLITIDAKGYIVDFNPAAERTFGYQQVEVIGEPMGDLIIPPAYRQAHNQGMGHFNKTGIGPVLNQRIEVEAMRRDGSLFPAELAVISFTRGGHQYFHGSMRDISERKALEKSRQEVREREMAYGSEIQRSLLFGRLPERIREVSIAVSAESSAGVDGDFYDLFSYRDDLFDIAIGDVMGKGVSAALVGAAVKMQLNRVLAEQWSHLCDGFNYSDQPGPLVCHGQANACSSHQIPSPATLINALHDKIGPRLIELDTFLTLSYLRVDVANRHLLMVDAGHTRAIHTGPDGLRLLSGDNLPLGVLDEECYVQRQVSISDGDLILLYSDGLTEARNDAGEEFGVERLGKLVDQLYQHGVPGPILLQAVRQQVREFEAYAPPGDDRTCIILHFAPTPRECIEPLRLPRDFAVLPTLRRWVGAAAKVVGLRDEAADAMLLAAVETVTNIMRHVPPKLSDAFILCEAEAFERGLQIDFIYLGEPFQPEDIEPDLSGESEGGFGLYIIRNSVDLDQYDCLAEGVNRIRLRKQVTDGDD